MSLRIPFFIILLFTFSIFGENADREHKRKELWCDFHIERVNRFGPNEHISLYAESNDLTEIAFICKEALYKFYHNSRHNDGKSYINRAQIQKAIHFPFINRITCNKDNRFELWYYEKKELTF